MFIDRDDDDDDDDDDVMHCIIQNIMHVYNNIILDIILDN